jgi:hypothetical protein
MTVTDVTKTFLCFYGNVLATSFTVILRPLDYGTTTRGNQSFTGQVTVAVTLWICIREALFSNLGGDIGYHE